jgi:hypothetical protein
VRRLQKYHEMNVPPVFSYLFIIFWSTLLPFLVEQAFDAGNHTRRSGAVCPSFESERGGRYWLRMRTRGAMSAPTPTRFRLYGKTGPLFEFYLWARFMLLFYREVARAERTGLDLDAGAERGWHTHMHKGTRLIKPPKSKLQWRIQRRSGALCR